MTQAFGVRAVLCSKVLAGCSACGCPANHVSAAELQDIQHSVLAVSVADQCYLPDLLCNPQVKTEHDILGQLSQQTLSFKVPAAKPALGSGEPYVVLSNGAAACVFEIIPGAGCVGGDMWRMCCMAEVQQQQQQQQQPGNSVMSCCCGIMMPLVVTSQQVAAAQIGSCCTVGATARAIIRTHRLCQAAHAACKALCSI